MNQWLIRNFTFPLWEFAAKRKTVQYQRLLEKSQWSQDIGKYQDLGFTSMVHHAIEKVPFYQKFVKDNKLRKSDFQSIDDLKLLPIINKEMIKSNLSDFTSSDSVKYSPILYPTGGTTGAPLHFLKAKDTFDWQMASAYRAWKWGGLDHGSPFVYLWGATRDMQHENKIKNKLHYWLTSNRLLMPSFDLSEKRMTEYFDTIKRKNPKILYGYVSPLMLLAQFAESKNINYSFDSVFTTAENLSGYQRKYIEKVFNCKIFDDYGSRETCVRATECDKHEGYHIAAENGMYEVVNKTKPTRDVGRVLVTDFRNYSMPLMRYENGDLAQLSNKTCSCGRTLPMLKQIQGRFSDVFVTPKGKYVPGELFVYLFLEFKGKEYQVVQDKKSEIVLKIVKGPNFDKKNLDDIVSETRKWFGKEVKITVKYVDEIPMTKTGKRRFTISNVKKEF